MRRYNVYLEIDGSQVRVGAIEGNSSGDARFLYAKDYISEHGPKAVKRRIVGGGFGGLFSANSPTARRFHPGECGLSAEIWRTSSGGRKRTRGLISAEEAPLLK